MEHKLNSTFPLWSLKTEELIRNPEDIAFLASMKGVLSSVAYVLSFFSFF